MYSDRKENHQNHGLVWVLALTLFVLLLSALVFRKQWSDPDEGGPAIRTAIQRSALQCYVVEGVYPPNLSYLEENYGLQINTSDYNVTYEAFASNLPPTVRVTRK